MGPARGDTRMILMALAWQCRLYVAWGCAAQPAPAVVVKSSVFAYARTLFNLGFSEAAVYLFIGVTAWFATNSDFLDAVAALRRSMSSK